MAGYDTTRAELFVGADLRVRPGGDERWLGIGEGGHAGPPLQSVKCKGIPKMIVYCFKQPGIFLPANKGKWFGSCFI